MVLKPSSNLCTMKKGELYKFPFSVLLYVNPYIYIYIWARSQWSALPVTSFFTLCSPVCLVCWWSIADTTPRSFVLGHKDERNQDTTPHCAPTSCSTCGLYPQGAVKKTAWPLYRIRAVTHVCGKDVVLVQRPLLGSACLICVYWSYL